MEAILIVLCALVAVIVAGIIILNPFAAMRFRQRFVYVGPAKPLSYRTGMQDKQRCFCTARGTTLILFKPLIGSSVIANYQSTGDTNCQSCTEHEALLIKKSDLASWLHANAR